MFASRFLLALFVLIGLCWLIGIYRTFSLPDVAYLKYGHPSHSSFMRIDSVKSLLTGSAIQLQQVWVPAERIAPALKRAVVAAEDDTFFEHAGFDWQAIKKAAVLNWKRRRFLRGASTITQQLARNLFLYPAKTPTRKLKEFLIALKLERELTKARILELYLNFAQWGPGVYGCEAAARHYFRGSCAGLLATQAAFLATILPNPKKLGRGGYRLTPRAQQILQRM
ncbi:MAG: monofunctional biosynthetic peptidoglycan transglycosylase [Deltaproteobacteria bacterium]|nr:monofunctional biosynthetic peptidoglycan transglycosylase [Deltaproteobacteria bacterium]